MVLKRRMAMVIKYYIISVHLAVAQLPESRACSLAVVGSSGPFGKIHKTFATISFILCCLLWFILRPNATESRITNFLPSLIAFAMLAFVFLLFGYLLYDAVYREGINV